jgi:SAM-dependent methyltransferase
MTEQQLSDIIQWDVKTWTKALNFWETKVDWSQQKSALELGARQGGLSLWLALKGLQVVCSDFGDVKPLAQPLHEKYKVTALIDYEDIDATAIPYENHFDMIVFKSIIGGIGYENNFERQQKAFSAMYKALKPGGILLFAENLSASALHRFLRRRKTDWGQAWRYLTRDEIHFCLQAFHKVEMHTTGFTATLGRSESQRRFFYYLDHYFFNHFTPNAWHYIAYGIAIKT